MEIEKSSLEHQLEEYLNKEKIARLENNSSKSEDILLQIVNLIWEQKQYQLLFDTIRQLFKKRGQSKKAQTITAQLCMKWIQEIQDKNLKIEFLECLKEVCDKKIYLEVEYARACLLLVKNKETPEQIEEAAKIMQEVQVETYGSMDRKEKLEFILYQMNIMIKKNDYVRLHIVSNKIQKKNLEDKEIYELKILYYSYLIHYYVHQKEYLNTANAYKQIFDTFHQNPDFYQKQPKTIDFNFNTNIDNAFQNFAIYTCLESYSPAQSTLINNLKQNYQNELEKNQPLLNLVDKLLSSELINNSYENYNLNAYQAFQRNTEHQEQHQKDLTIQLIQHNLRIVDKYYSKISLARVSNLLNISVDQAEEQICEMINIKQIKGKIDRQQGIVNFRLTKGENELLDDWSRDLNNVLNLIDQTCNLIKRE